IYIADSPFPDKLHTPQHFLCISFLLFSHRPLTSTLFPYTTLFRSSFRNTGAEEDPTCPSPRRPSQLGREGVVASAHRRRAIGPRSEEHTSELQSRGHLVCRLLLEKKKLANTVGSMLLLGFFSVFHN